MSNNLSTVDYYVSNAAQKLIVKPPKFTSVNCGVSKHTFGSLLQVGDVIEMLDGLTQNDSDMENTQEAIKYLINYLEG